MSGEDHYMPLLTVKPLEIDEDKPTDDIPESFIKEIEQDEVFNDVIGSIIKQEPRPEWKESITNSQCFARQWKDLDDGSYCSIFSCDLRKLCEQTWEHVQYGYAFEFSGSARYDYRFVAKRPERKFGPPKRKIPQKNEDAQLSEKNYHKRKFKKPFKKFLEYRSTGRPIDYLANELWNFLDKPKSLPDSFRPFKRTDLISKKEAAEKFMATYGSDIVVLRRVSYHMYYYKGQRLCRFHMLTAYGGWLDCSDLLSVASFKLGLKLEKVPKLENSPKRYKDFSHRIYFKKRRELMRFAPAFTRIKGLSHLRKNIELDDFGL